jgi:hypothetical protein
MLNVRYAQFLAIASVALAPLAAHSQDSRAQACVDAFIAENFAGQAPIVKLERDDFRASPIAYAAPFEMRLTATSRAGDVLVTAVCRPSAGAVALTLVTRSPVLLSR